MEVWMRPTSKTITMTKTNNERRIGMKAKIARLVKRGKKVEALALFDKYMSKRENNRKPSAPRPSLLDAPHTYCSDDDWEHYIEFGFLPDYTRTYSDEEVEDWIDDRMRMRVTVPWDCSGQLFSAWIDWHRNPSGLISYRHCIGIDI